MLRAVVAGERRAELVEADTPRALGEWALVKVHVAPMCTEYKGFLSGADAQFLGHEAVGEVVEVACEGPVKVGDRVVAMPLAGCGVCPLCRSGDYIYCEHAPNFAKLHASREGSATMAQYLLKQSWLLMPIPDDVSYEKAALACCALGPSFGAFERMNVGASDTVLVTGAGPVGLGAVVNARFRNARALVVDGNTYRAELAARLGAEHVFDPAAPNLADQIKEFTGGVGVDAAVDCSGAPAAQRVCIDSTRRRGQVAFVGECFDKKLEIGVSSDMIRKGLTLFGSWHYNLADYSGVLDVIRRSPLADQLVSHELPLRCVQEAMELSASQNCAKILLKPWD
jgi:L-iditol 2-dehydrogenase